MTDQTSLDLLNDIVVADAVTWWPPAPGWYVVVVLLLIVFLIVAWRALKQWRQNRYRRLALQELAEMRARGDAAAIAGLSELLKRTALCAWPRSTVAGLSGPDWHGFLDQSAGMTVFSGGAGALLDRLAYGTGGHEQPSTAEMQSLVSAAEGWLKHHRTGNEGV